MSNATGKGQIFRDLHGQKDAFLIPNPWDAGTACLLERLGFRALATTSAGYAFSVGRRDGAVARDAMIAHIATIAATTPLPVSADLQNGFGDHPEDVAEAIRLAAEAGAVGGSIEDATGDDAALIYAKEQAAERIRAAAEAARALPHSFTLTARAENYLLGQPDLRDTIERLQLFQDAGADVLYAPGLRRREDIVEVVRSVNRPVNVLMGIPGVALTVKELSLIGVKRISVGSALSRTALGAFLTAAREMRSEGTFRFAEDAVSYASLNDSFANRGVAPREEF